ncbi:polysaccharide biosynthesis protein [Rhodobacteraceae bacterium CH30]|nr:polysaccharide biosynthesis protein [Rhodobacteraceae bacterium CH30]
MLRVRLKALTAGDFARNVMTLAGGAAIAQFLPLAASPLLTRLYTPAEFGVLAIYVAWLSNLAVLMTGRYDMAIVLPDDEQRAANLMGLSLWLSLALSLLVLLAVLAGHHELSALAQAPALSDLLLWLPLSLLLAGGMQAWNSWNNRHQRYRANAGGRMALALGMTATQLGAGFAGLGALGLVLGQLVGQGASLVVQAWHDIRHRFGWRQDVSRPGMREVARMYSEFPRINAPHAFIGALQDTLAVTLLTLLSGSVTVGLYGLMMRVLKMPAALVGQAVAQVAYRDMAAAKNRGESLLPYLNKTLAILSALALPPFFVIMLWGDSLFAWVFGEDWRMAGNYARALSPYILFHFVASPLGMVPLVINRQRTAFAFTVAGSALFLSALWGGFVFWQDVSAAFALVSVVMTLYFSCYFVWLWRAVRP